MLDAELISLVKEDPLNREYAYQICRGCRSFQTDPVSRTEEARIVETCFRCSQVENIILEEEKTSPRVQAVFSLTETGDRVLEGLKSNFEFSVSEMDRKFVDGEALKDFELIAKVKGGVFNGDFAFIICRGCHGYRSSPESKTENARIVDQCSGCLRTEENEYRYNSEGPVVL